MDPRTTTVARLLEQATSALAGAAFHRRALLETSEPVAETWVDFFQAIGHAGGYVEDAANHPDLTDGDARTVQAFEETIQRWYDEHLARLQSVLVIGYHVLTESQSEEAQAAEGLRLLL